MFIFNCKKNNASSLSSNSVSKIIAPLAFAISMTISTPVLSDMFISSFGTNEVMRFHETTGEFLGSFDTVVNGPFASQIGFNGDLFVSSFHTGEVLRFKSDTGEFLGAFIAAGTGGLTNPTAPNFGPDGLVYVGDLASNSVLRYDDQGNFLDVFADGQTSDLDGPFMQTFDDTTMYIASGYTNSILRYDLETKEYLGEFVPSGSGGVVVPVGLEFGPDGNLYTSSSGTSSVIRYDGKTGEFIDVFVPSGSGGMDSPRAIRFGGPNSDLYVVSSNTNNVLRYDRTTGEFLKVELTDVESGFVAPRGLTFSPRPEFFIESHRPLLVKDNGYSPVKILQRLNDFTDQDPKVELLSITVNDPARNIDNDIKGAQFGEDDKNFLISSENLSANDRVYTITYRATNNTGVSTLATTTVTVPGQSL